MEFELKTEFVELFKVLKILSLAESGGQAKLFIEEGEVKLNGIIENRKRAKLRKGDVVEIFEQQIKII